MIFDYLMFKINELNLNEIFFNNN